MDSENKYDLDALAMEFLNLLNEIISWRELPEDVTKNKWRILAKRIMASSGDDIQEFLHNIVKSIAGDEFRIKHKENRLGKTLEEFLKKVKSQGKEKELIDYIKSRAIPLVIRLSAEKGAEKD